MVPRGGPPFTSLPRDALRMTGGGRAAQFATACRRRRVRAAFFAEAERACGLRAAEWAPPMRPPFRAGALSIFLPRPEPPSFCRRPSCG